MSLEFSKVKLAALTAAFVGGSMLVAQSAPVEAAPAPPTPSVAAVQTVSGQVVDPQGEPLMGVTISVNGKNVGATDFDGKFTVKAKEGDTLGFSYVGYSAANVKVAGTGPVNVTMQEDSKTLDEVVVTALGIRKEAKALTYNVQEVKSDEVVAVKDANFVNSLAGKVAGVSINTSSVGIGGGSKVVMRGSKSLSGNNNALYVIDGVPMPSLEWERKKGDDVAMSGQGQSGDGAAMINPEDIESMSVLSGAAASALYGSQAANGVIMITTKKGNSDHLRVSYSNSTLFLRATAMPEFQNTYGAATGEFTSWGDKLGTPSSYDPADFFQTGYNETNALTVSAGNERNQTFLSLAATNAEGIVKNNTLDRYNFTVRNTTQLIKDKLRLDVTATYMNVREKNMVSHGQYMNPIVATYLMSPSYGLDPYKNYERYDASRNIRVQYWPWGNMGLGMQNPYWITNRDKLINHKNRYLISAGLYWDNVVKGLNISARAKVDNTDGLYEKKYYAGTDAIFAGTFGQYEKTDDRMRQLYGDVMANYDNTFGPVSLTAVLGASINDLRYNKFYVGGQLNSVANKFTLLNLNSATIGTDQYGYHEQEQSIYATAQLGFWSKVYLDLAGRIDWNSSLGWTDSDHVAYPSVGLSAILTDIIPGLQNDVLSFLKVRGSYSEVGNAPTRYIAYQTYPFESGTPSTATTYPNTDIKPERTKAWEIGLQSRFWMDKLTLNVSLYKTSTYNQLFNPSLSSGSGYESIYINGGQIDNKGIELSLGINQPLGPVQWESNFTYTLNRNNIKKLLKPTTLANGLTVKQDMLDIATFGNVKSRLVEGGSIGDLYVTTFLRDEQGNIVVNYADNSVYQDKTAGDNHDGWVYAGNAEPKYTMGWRNMFHWNGLSLGFLINARVGGRVVSMTQAYMDAYGTSQTSADARDNNGVMVNGIKLPAAEKYLKFAGNNIGENYVYSATNVRLAELTFGYDIPVNKWLNWVSGLNVSFIGRNLFFFYKKAPYDPELTGFTSMGMSGMDYFMLPSMRQLGFSVKATF